MTAEKFEELCVPLIEFDRSNPDDPTIYMAHRTAREFLDQNPDEIADLKDHPELRSFFVSVQERHRELGIACLKYLLYRLQSRKLDDKFKTEVNQGNPKYAFLKYASIHWYHHLGKIDTTSVLGEAPELIERFLKSPQLLNCCWIQSQFAPYSLARLTPESDTNFTINSPKDVYPAVGMTLAAYEYSDPIPEWFSKHNEALFRQFQDLVSEFGLVFIRRRGGMKHYSAALLAGEVLLAPCGSSKDRWKSLALHGDKLAVCAPTMLPPTGLDATPSRHQVLLSFTKRHIHATTVTITSSSAACVMFYFTKWKVSLIEKRRPQLAFVSSWTAVGDMDGKCPPMKGVIGEVPSDFFVESHGDQLYISPGSGALDIFYGSGEPSQGKIVPLGINSPGSVSAPYEEKDPVALRSCFHGRHMVKNDDVALVVSRWLIMPGRCPLHTRPHQLSRRNTAELGTKVSRQPEDDSSCEDSDSDINSDGEPVGRIASLEDSDSSSSDEGEDSDASPSEDLLESQGHVPWRLDVTPCLGSNTDSGNEEDIGSSSSDNKPSARAYKPWRLHQFRHTDSNSSDAEENDEDEESGEDEDEESEASSDEVYGSDSGYSTQSRSQEEEVERVGGRTVLQCRAAGGEISELVFRVSRVEAPLRCSPPVLHPTKRVFVLPIDSQYTLISSYDDSESPPQHQHDSWCDHEGAISKGIFAPLFAIAGR